METEINTKGDFSLHNDFLPPDTKTKYKYPIPDRVQKNNDLSSELLEPSHDLNWGLLDLLQTLPETQKNTYYDQLLNTPKPIGRTTFRFKRSGISGKINSYKEEFQIEDLDNANSGNSLSLNRKFTSKAESLKGKTSFLPFQPGGLISNAKVSQTSESMLLHRNKFGLYDTPQGLSRGLNVQEQEEESSDLDDLYENDKSNNDDTQESEHIVHDISEVDSSTVNLKQVSNIPFDSEEIDGIIPMDYDSILNNLSKKTELRKDWAHVVDLGHKIENFKSTVPNMAREWPFELDNFQQEAIYHLEQGDSVFVAAHTSAGKTVVAEYAIAMAKRNITKVIYTSPIKALSNQKFRDFKETFKDVDVGLVTGDVQINPEASCLIMTTEILRSMLYRGADLIRDVEFVVFDEVHYVNDIDRGVVWEEVIIMLPDHIKYILLSATVPNTFEFANWVGRTKQKDIYVISTPKRPVPLEIFVWAKGDLFKVVDAQRKFSESEFKKHKEVLEKGSKKGLPSLQSAGTSNRRGRGGTARGGNRGGGQVAGRGAMQQRASGRQFMRDGPNKNTWLTLVQYLKQHNLLPAVMFVFSKKKCEEYAETLSSVDFCTAREKSEIHMFIDRSVSRLKKEDRELPQILKIREMLSRGIAVHHGGMLPIVKEVIEILFAKTLVKVLFATETFAMGLNLPTRTVVFNTLRKHDDRGFRNLLPGEFTQMSGRAGRRGLDATGTVIVMSFNEPLSPTDFKEVTLGAPTKLLSQFRLTYNMILNLLRIEALRVEEMIKHSFSENSTQQLLPEHQKAVQSLSEELNNTKITECTECNLKESEDLFHLLVNYEELYGNIVENVQSLAIIRNTLLKTGRLICYRDKNGILKIGFFVRTDVNTSTMLVLTFDHGKEYDEQSKKYQFPYIPVPSYLALAIPKIVFSGSLTVESIPWTSVNFLCRYSLKAHIKGILQNNKESIKEAVDQIRVILKLQNKWEEADFYQAIQLSLHELLEKRSAILEKIKNTQFCPNFRQHFFEFNEKNELQKQISSLQRLISDENLELLPDYEQRLAVLESLGFIDEYHNVVLKGRVACEINSGWELVMTELILDNFLGDFEPEEIVALLSCFVYEGRTNEEEAIPITPRLEKGKGKIMVIVEKLLKVFTNYQVLLTSEEEEFLERKRFALVNVVYEWARGLSFNEIMQMSVEPEGTIVRVITRLDEICREVKNAALIIGDFTLHSKMSEAQEKIKRDIVFCASLYL